MGLYDPYRFGQSRIVPFIPGEHPMARHNRRMATNLAYQETVAQRCRAHAIEFQVKNQGHHWIFNLDGRLAEWWPSSAKFVFQKRWHEGHHVHDFEQAWKLLVREWGVTPSQEQHPAPQQPPVPKQHPAPQSLREFLELLELPGV